MMKTILVTGATGFLGQSVVNELLKTDDFEVVAIGGRPEDKVNPLPMHPRLKQFHLEDLFIEPFIDIDTVVNCAFARSNDATLLAEAFDFTEKLIKRLETLKVKSVINLSSQGVYKRLPVGELSTEQSPIEPIDLYSMAKYASEKLFAVSAIPYVTNVRLASLMMPQRFLYFFVQNAVHKEAFTVTAPNQHASLLDVKDAASALVAIINLSAEQRSKIYNIGIGTQYSLLEYATSVKTIGAEYGYDVDFTVSDNSQTLCAGMDISRIVKDTVWQPTVFKNDMIRNLFSQMR